MGCFAVNVGPTCPEALRATGSLSGTASGFFGIGGGLAGGFLGQWLGAVLAARKGALARVLVGFIFTTAAYIACKALA